MADGAGLSLESAAPIASTVIGGLEAGLSYLEKRRLEKKQNQLLAQRKAYQTPQEIFDILNATKSNASVGFDPATLDYLTAQTDNAFSGSLDVVNRLGGDPNDASALFNDKINQILKVTSEDQQIKTAKFSQFLSALGGVASNKAAEDKSKQDILKDKLQAAGLDIQTSTSNIGSGISTALSGLSAFGIQDMYNPDGTLKTKAQKVKANSSAYSDAQQSNANNTAGFIN